MTGATSRTRAGYMAMQPSPARTLTGAVVYAQGAGDPVNAGGIPGLGKILPGTGGGDLLLIEEVIPAGKLVRAHVHREVTQWSLVTDGVLVFRVGDEEYPVGRNEFIIRPPGVVHAVWNPGPADARQFEGNMPGRGMLDFYRQFGALSAPGLLAPGELAELAAGYGTLYDDRLTAEIEAAHGVTAAGGGPRR